MQLKLGNKNVIHGITVAVMYFKRVLNFYFSTFKQKNYETATYNKNASDLMSHSNNFFFDTMFSFLSKILF